MRLDKGQADQIASAFASTKYLHLSRIEKELKRDERKRRELRELRRKMLHDLGRVCYKCGTRLTHVGEAQFVCRACNPDFFNEALWDPFTGGQA